MEILEKLFGSTAKVKILRTFLFNQDQVFETKTLRERLKLRPDQIRNELSNFEKIGLIRKKKGKTETLWALNQNFPYFPALQNLFMTISPFTNEEVIRRLSRTGKVKAVILSGIFIHRSDSRADILVVVDQMKKPAFKLVMKNLESELGRELRYAALDSEEFKYRKNVGDRLIRDILDYPHEIVLDKVGVKS